jgi:RND family efflux transporter MFP subunit
MRINTLLALITVPFLAACGESAQGASPATPAAIVVQLADVVPAGGGSAIVATGTLGAKDEMPLSFKIGGIVARVTVDAGTNVRRGQVLAVLDQREIDALVTRATAAAQKARRDAERAERLYRDSVTTLAQLQDAQTAREAAEADLRAARVNQEYATIVAPADGVILRRPVNPGQLVSAGTAVVDFASRARGSVLRAGLPDRDVVRVTKGASATVAFDAVPDRTFHGSVSQVGASADPRTGTFTVEVTLASVGALPSGLVGRLEITAASRTRVASGEGVAAIPAEALVEGDGERGVVYTVDATAARARRLPVTLVGLEGDRLLVRGLDGVQRVVGRGATWLVDSARVEVKP